MLDLYALSCIDFAGDKIPRHYGFAYIKDNYCYFFRFTSKIKNKKGKELNVFKDEKGNPFSIRNLFTGDNCHPRSFLSSEIIRMRLTEFNSKSILIKNNSCIGNVNYIFNYPEFKKAIKLICLLLESGKYIMYQKEENIEQYFCSKKEEQEILSSFKISFREM